MKYGGAYREQSEEMMMNKENEEKRAVEVRDFHHLAVLVVDSEGHAGRC